MAAYPALPIALMLSDELPNYQVIATTFEAGYTQTRAKATIAPRTLHVKHVALSIADAATWETFWNAHKGGAVAFTYTHPRTGAGFTARFKADAKPTIDLTPGSANLYDVNGIVMEEAL